MKIRTLFRASLLCGMGLLFYGLVAGKGGNVPSDIRSKLSSESQEELAQARSAILGQRRRTIESLLGIVQARPMRENNVPAVVNAIDILGQMRATEAVEHLLDMIEFHRVGGEGGVGLPGRIPITTTEPAKLGKEYPCVSALIRIRVPPERVLDWLSGESNVIRLRCYIGVLRGVEGDELSLIIVGKAVERESDSRKASRLRDALNLLKRSKQIE